MKSKKKPEKFHKFGPLSDWWTFMPREDITLKELAKVVKLMKLRMDFTVINVPKKMKRHFMKMENDR